MSFGPISVLRVIVGGNALRVLLNGDEIFPTVIKAIRSARTSITCVPNFVEDDPVADEVIEARGRAPLRVPRDSHA